MSQTTDALVMQPAAVETGVVCCIGYRDPPFCPDPFPWCRHTFPWGFHIQHLPCPPLIWPTHSKSQRASGLAFLNKGHPHTPAERVRGHHLGMKTLPWPGRASTHILMQHSKGEKGLLTLPTEWAGFYKTLHQLLKTRSLFILSGCSVKLLHHVIGECEDSRMGSSLWCLMGLLCCLLPRQALKESPGPHQSACTFHNSWQRDSTLSAADGCASGCPRQAPIVQALGFDAGTFAPPLLSQKDIGVQKLNSKLSVYAEIFSNISCRF